jgi:tetratricopeptide (TPR) repeat protein
MNLFAQCLCPLLLLITAGIGQGQPLFRLSDSDPDSPEFRRRFLASHGVNEAIEPKLTLEDRPLQEAILPHLRDNPREAIALVEQALTPETNPAFLNILGNLYYQVEDYAAAERYLRQTLEKFPTLRRAWRTLALCHVQRERYRDAIEPLLKVIELGGGDAQSYGLLAYSHLANEKYESALAAYRMARMFKPDSLDFRRGQAQCLLMTEQHAAAVALFDELLMESPGETEFWRGQANAFLALEDYGKAIANLEIIADSGKADWAGLTLLGDLYLNQDAAHLALATYRRALMETTPGNWADSLRPLKYFLQRHLFSEARDYLQILREKTAGKLDQRAARELVVAEAHVEMETGDAKKARVALEKVVGEDPLDGASLLLLGEYHQRLPDFEQAEYYFERAASAPNHEFDARVALGRLAVDRGDMKGALVPLRAALRLRASPNVERYIEAIQRAIDARR